VNGLKGEELLKYKSIKNWFDSLNRAANNRGKDGLSRNAKAMRIGRMWEFTNKGELNPDTLLVEAQEDIKKTGRRLDDYFFAKKKVTSHNTALTSVSYIRGFFSHNDLSFPRSIALPKKVEAKVATQDEKTNFYDFDEETEEFVFKNGNLQHFVQNLNFRDQTIALCLLSTGADATDILNLKVGFVKDVKGEMCKKKCFFWHGNRSKTNEPFRTFFSEEATEFLKRYVEQERANAKDNEPLFVQSGRTYTRKNPKTKEIETVTEDEKFNAHALSMNFREAAKKMDYVKEGEANPFRPKRFRHLFRTACAIAETDGGYVKAMMGHASDISAGYLEKNSAIFKKVYLKVEPFLTVFGANRNLVNKMSQEVDKLNKDFTQYSQRTLSLEAKIEDLNEQLKSATEIIYSFEPVLNTFSAIADTKEGQELINKIREAKIRQEIKEAQEQAEKEHAEITTEHPKPKEAKTSQKIIPPEKTQR